MISISWGGPESSWTAQSMTAFDQAFQAAAALGVTICVAAGDDGSTRRRQRQRQPCRLSRLQPACAGLRRDQADGGRATPSRARWCGTSWRRTRAPPAAASARSSRCPPGRRPAGVPAGGTTTGHARRAGCRRRCRSGDRLRRARGWHRHGDRRHQRGGAAVGGADCPDQ